MSNLLLPDLRYSEPQRKLKAEEPETRIVAAVDTRKDAQGKLYTQVWLHPQFNEIYARDIARGRRDELESPVETRNT